MKTTFKKEKSQSKKIISTYQSHINALNKLMLQQTKVCQTQLYQDCQSLQDQKYTSEKHPV